MKESEVYKKIVKPWCRKNGIFARRFESIHIPDVYMARGNNVLWGELKCVHTEKSIVRPDWRVGQLAWIKENQHYGNTNICLILFYCGQTFWLEPKEEYTEEELVCQRDQYLIRLNRK